MYHNPVGAVRYLAEVISEAGVRPVAVLWNVGSARLLGALLEMGVLTKPVYSELTLSDTLLSTHPGTVAGMHAYLDFLPPGWQGEWSVLSVGGNILPLVSPTVAAGATSLSGSATTRTRKLGTPTNAELVAAVVDRLAGAGPAAGHAGGGPLRFGPSVGAGWPAGSPGAARRAGGG